MADPTLDQQPRSKATRISGERQDGQIIKRIAYDPKEAPTLFKDEIPELGDPHPYFPDDLYFIDADFRPTDGKYGDLVLNYSWKREGEFDIQLSSNLREEPLSNHPNYELRWDHYLVGGSEGATVPSWWTDVENPLKTIEDFKEKDTNNEYSVVTNINASSKNVISSRLKPKNTYMKPTTVIRERIWYASEDKAAGGSLAIGNTGTPLKFFGRGEMSQFWLCTSAPITRDGGYWMVERTWEYSQELNNLSSGNQSTGWDLDIYSLG